MVKLLLLIFLLSFNYAKDFNQAIKDIIGKNVYYSKKDFINIIFKNKEEYKIGGYINYVKLLKKLQDEKILNLPTVSSPLRVAFITYSPNIEVFFKAIKDTLFSLGFSNIYTIKATKRGSKFVWVVSLGNNYMLNPYLFSKEMSDKSVLVEDMKRYTATNWSYVLNTKNANVIPTELEYDTLVKLPKSMNAYWINVSKAKKAQIQSYIGNTWHPYIVLYNKDLKIISTILKNRKTDKININIPHDAKFLKIDDYYSIKNLKDGLGIFLQKRAD